MRQKDVPGMIKLNKPPVLFVFYLLASLLLTCCSMINQNSYEDSLPVLSRDELIRPYTKIGRIQVSRETYGSDYVLTPDIRAWGIAAVRQEAEKLGADAIILPEVIAHSTTNGIIPSTEYIATGFAIKFK